MCSLSCPQLCNNRNGTTGRMLRSVGKVGQNRKYIQTGKSSAGKGGGESLSAVTCVCHRHLVSQQGREHKLAAGRKMTVFMSSVYGGI